MVHGLKGIPGSSGVVVVVVVVVVGRRFAPPWNLRSGKSRQGRGLLPEDGVVPPLRAVHGAGRPTLGHRHHREGRPGTVSFRVLRGGGGGGGWFGFWFGGGGWALEFFVGVCGGQVSEGCWEELGVVGEGCGLGILAVMLFRSPKEKLRSTFDNWGH